MAICLLLIGVGYFSNLLGHREETLVFEQDSVILVAALWSSVTQTWASYLIFASQIIFKFFCVASFWKNDRFIEQKSPFTNLSVGLTLSLVAMIVLRLWDDKILEDGLLLEEGGVIPDDLKRKLSSAWIVYMCLASMGWVMTMAGLLRVRLFEDLPSRMVVKGFLLVGFSLGLGFFALTIVAKSINLGLACLIAATLLILAGPAYGAIFSWVGRKKEKLDEPAPESQQLLKE